MPPVTGKKPPAGPDPIEEQIRLYEAFAAGFRPSRSNPANPTREFTNQYGMVRVTIFADRYGGYKWAVRDADDNRGFSDDPFDDIPSAMYAVWLALNGVLT